MKRGKMSLDDADKIILFVDELQRVKHQKEVFFNSLKQAGANPLLRKNFLQGKSEQDWRDVFNRQILHLLDKIEEVSDTIASTLDAPLQTQDGTPPLADEIPVPLPSKKVYKSKKKRSQYLKEIGVSDKVMKRLGKLEKLKKLTEIDYTVYKTSWYGRLANTFFRGFSNTIAEKHLDFFNQINHALRMADIKILVRTYLSMMLFTPLLIFLFFSILLIPLTLVVMNNPLISILISFAVSFVFAAASFGLFYLYPSLVVGNRNRLIKNDLPFAIMHMAAIAGSGAQPVAMFRLLLNAREYKGLESEIKKIVNYVNLFGYDLSTALKTVAASTPSKRFKDILSGIAATIEAGGSLKSYLKSIAEDTMNTYKLERKKYVETLSTYSDIYTGVLIAAPLLFIVTLAIINILGGAIGGLSVATLATVGTYAVIPLLNVIFILFLNIMQPE